MPNSYTISDVKKADRLYDEMPLTEVGEEMGIPYQTLQGWHSRGMIGTDKNHQTKYDAQTISRADELYDVMPLPKIPNVLDVPFGTLRLWASKGWISSEVNWQAQSGGYDKIAPARTVVEEWFDTDKTQKEVGEEYGIAPSTVSKYVSQYRNGEL